MGGDHAPSVTVEGAALALRASGALSKIEKLFLVGDEKRVKAELDRIGLSDSRIELVHASQVVEMDDLAVQALRRKKDSSVSQAVNLVKEGKADAIVTAGHTGAAVAETTIKLRTLEGIERPGIAAVLPTERNVFVLIDAGANVNSKPIHLLQYAIMGSVYSKLILGYANPRVGLMSIGEEDVKGNELTKETFKLLEKSDLNFIGNVEGNDLFSSPVEVVVCDGFVGNVVLKTTEATALAMAHWLKTELMKSPFRMLGAWLSRGAFRAIKKKTDYAEYGGALLLGINGICIIGHGVSSDVAVKNAIRVAAESVEQKVKSTILEELRKNLAFVTPSNHENSFVHP
jgi:glycerol-3-phosphate acyltransferase PlsX